MAENRTEIKQREYLIGDMSEIVGVSRDTLRFYEKKGIIKARKKENGYRYYLEEDLFRLMVILYKRKMNDSLEEIEGYIKGENSVEYMKKHLQTRIKQEEPLPVCGLPQKIFKWQSNTVENVPGKIFR